MAEPAPPPAPGPPTAPGPASQNQPTDDVGTRKGFRRYKWEFKDSNKEFWIMGHAEVKILCLGCMIAGIKLFETVATHPILILLLTMEVSFFAFFIFLYSFALNRYILFVYWPITDLFNDLFACGFLIGGIVFALKARRTMPKAYVAAMETSQRQKDPKVCSACSRQEWQNAGPKTTSNARGQRGRRGIAKGERGEGETGKRKRNEGERKEEGEEGEEKAAEEAEEEEMTGQRHLRQEWQQVLWPGLPTCSPVGTLASLLFFPINKHLLESKFPL